MRRCSGQSGTWQWWSAKGPSYRGCSSPSTRSSSSRSRHCCRASNCPNMHARQHHQAETKISRLPCLNLGHDVKRQSIRNHTLPRQDAPLTKAQDTLLSPRLTSHFYRPRNPTHLIPAGIPHDTESPAVPKYHEAYQFTPAPLPIVVHEPLIKRRHSCTRMYIQDCPQT
jgi:hypothetical protein